MARARNIKPSFFTSEQVADNCPLGRLLFIGLWTQADYKGDIEWKARTLKIQILPWDECDIKQLAINLDKSGLIRFYSDGNNVYVNIPNFERHQNPHKNEREKGSDIPEYSEDRRQLVDLNTLTINPDKSRVNRNDSQSDRADSLLLIPDSPIPDCGIPHSAPEPVPAPKSKPVKFIKPSIDQLTNEFRGRVADPPHEAQAFLNHYESNGWKVGKNPMKSWPHAVTNWITRSSEYATRKSAGNQSFSRSERNEESFLAYIAELDNEQETVGSSVASVIESPPGARSGRQH